MCIRDSPSWLRSIDPVGGRTAAPVSKGLRESVAAARQALRDQYLRDPKPRRMLRDHADLVDRTVRTLWDEAGAPRGAPASSHSVRTVRSTRSAWSRSIRRGFGSRKYWSRSACRAAATDSRRPLLTGAAVRPPTGSILRSQLG